MARTKKSVAEAQKKTSSGGRSKRKSAGAIAPHVALKTATVKTKATARRTSKKTSAATSHGKFKGLTIILEGETHDGDHDRFCSRCHDVDPDVNWDCDFCPRMFCGRCVVRTPNKPEPDDFKCPHCHRFGSGEEKVNKAPYDNGYVYIGQHSTRENWARCRSEPLTIISARLKGMAFNGSAGSLIYGHLFPYLLGNLVLVDFEFCLDSDEGYDALTRDLSEMVEKFAKGGRLEHFQRGRFLVILTDHSSPDTGDVHIVPDNAGATTLEGLFNYFLEGGLRTVLADSDERTLVLLSCGGVVAHKGPIEYLKQITTPSDGDKPLFMQAIAFAQPNLQLTFTNKFMVDYAQKKFIHAKDHIGATIFEHQTLGPHTDLILFKGGKRTRFFWAHPVVRPHGEIAPTICSRCKCLTPWVDAEAKRRKKGAIKDHKVDIVHKCEHCGLTITYKFREKVQWLRGHGYDSTERGCWLWEDL